MGTTPTSTPPTPTLSCPTTCPRPRSRLTYRPSRSVRAAVLSVRGLSVGAALTFSTLVLTLSTHLPHPPADCCPRDQQASVPLPHNHLRYRWRCVHSGRYPRLHPVSISQDAEEEPAGEAGLRMIGVRLEGLHPDGGAADMRRYTYLTSKVDANQRSQTKCLIGCLHDQDLMLFS